MPPSPAGIATTIPTVFAINIIGPCGPLRVDSSGSPVYTSSTGGGFITETRFVAFQPLDTSSTVAVQPGGQLILWSAHTGLFCKVADISAIPNATSAKEPRHARSSVQPTTRTNRSMTSKPRPPPPRPVQSPGRQRVYPPPPSPLRPRATRPAAAGRGARVIMPPPAGRGKVTRSPVAQTSNTAAGTLGLLCNQRDPGAASVISFTGTAFVYQNSPLASSGAGQLLVATPGGTTSTCPITSFPLGGQQKAAARGCCLTVPKLSGREKLAQA
jgi:hypothetical protein